MPRTAKHLLVPSHHGQHCFGGGRPRWRNPRAPLWFFHWAFKTPGVWRSSPTLSKYDGGGSLPRWRGPISRVAKTTVKHKISSVRTGAGADCLPLAQRSQFYPTGSTWSSWGRAATAAGRQEEARPLWEVSFPDIRKVPSSLPLWVNPWVKPQMTVIHQPSELRQGFQYFCVKRGTFAQLRNRLRSTTVGWEKRASEDRSSTVLVKKIHKYSPTFVLPRRNKRTIWRSDSHLFARNMRHFIAPQ